jgi:hypothetical protein
VVELLMGRFQIATDDDAQALMVTPLTKLEDTIDGLGACRKQQHPLLV